MAGQPFVPTHTVPVDGMSAWTEPDGTGPAAARLDPRLEVRLLELRDEWAHILCSNGWEAWVDGRRLVALHPDPGTPAPPSAAAGPAPAPPAGPGGTAATAATATLVVEAEPTAPAAAPGRAGIEIRGLSLVSLVGAVAIAGGSFLDWWSFGPVGASAWDIPVKFLLTGKTGDGIDTGPLLLLLAAVLAVTLVIGRRLPDLVLLVVAALAIGIALAAFVRGVTDDPTVYPEAGLLITMAGGALVAIDGFGLLSGTVTVTPAPADDKLLGAMAADRSGCVGAMVFWLILILFGCAGLVGSNPDRPEGSAQERRLDTALGLLPALDTARPAPTTIPTVPVTEAPAPPTDAPAAVAPQSPSGGGQTGGGAPPPQQQQAQPPPPPPAEVCALTGSATVSGGSGSLSSTGGSYVANGPSGVTVSGYPTCHSPRYGIRVESASGWATGCFLDNYHVALNSSQAGETVTVTIKLGC